MRGTAEERLESALADYAAGLSLRECEKMNNVNYKKIEREVKKRGVQKGELSQIITEKIRVDSEVSRLCDSQRNKVNKEVEKRLKHLEFFSNAAVKNVREAMSADCENQNDFRSRAETIAKGKETVIGKSPDVAVQINNSVTIEDLLSDL